MGRISVRSLLLKLIINRTKLIASSGIEEYAREVFPIEEAANGMTWMN